MAAAAASLLHHSSSQSVGRSFGREGRKRKEKVDRMEGKGSFPLHYHTARPAGPPTGARCASIWNGGTGRTDGRRRGGKEGRKERRSPEERGASTTLLKKATEKRGADRRGEEREKQTNKASSSPPSLPHSPHAPLSPPFPCGASFVLLLFLRANYIIYDAVHPRKEIHFGEGS